MEEWRDIRDFEGMYQVSNRGRVRSLDRIDARNRRIKGRILAAKYGATGNYQQVCLCKDGVHHYIAIHRLVAEAFIPNPENKPTVNHIDENKQNNNIENLEWATYMENAHHGTRIQRCYANRDYKEIMRKSRETKIAKGIMKHVYQYDLNMNLIAEYDSVVDASKILGIDPSGIGKVARTNTPKKTYKGFIWRYNQLTISN